MEREWLKLTDRYGSPISIRREGVKVFYGNSVLEGDGEKQMTIHGTTVVVEGGYTYFVTDTPEEVSAKFDVPE